MFKRCIIFLNFIFFISILLFQNTVFALDSFEDKDGERVSLNLRSKVSPLRKERKVFMTSFMDNYKEIPPHELRSAFKDHLDVRHWLEETFAEEQTLFKESPHVFCIRAKSIKQNLIVGMMFFECFFKGDRSKIIHIRQAAVKPRYQRKGIGSRFLAYVKKLHPDFSEIIVDGRRINTKAGRFYLANGFTLLESPHDKALQPQEKYVGYSFKPSSAP